MSAVTSSRLYVATCEQLASESKEKANKPLAHSQTVSAPLELVKAERR